jgi:predicted TIM-barrel fold metal-dependent hydrolase
VFASEFPHEIAMEDAFHAINEILERQDINDKHEAMIFGENPKRFYNL